MVSYQRKTLTRWMIEIWYEREFSGRLWRGILFAAIEMIFLYKYFSYIKIVFSKQVWRFYSFSLKLHWVTKFGIITPFTRPANEQCFINGTEMNGTHILRMLPPSLRVHNISYLNGVYELLVTNLKSFFEEKKMKKRNYFSFFSLRKYSNKILINTKIRDKIN